jgi:hypothetical protein
VHRSKSGPLELGTTVTSSEDPPHRQEDQRGGSVHARTSRNPGTNNALSMP